MQSLSDNPPANLNGVSDRTLGAVRISGSDRLELLQGQLTQDMNQLTPNQPLLAGWTSPKGRLICVCWLLDWQEAIWMLMPAALRDSIAQRLRMYVLRADAQVETPAVTVQPADPDLMGRQAFPNVNPNDSSVINCFYSDNYFYLQPAENAGLVVCGDVPAGNMDAWRLALIRAGLPSVWTETQEAFLPQMLNLDLLNAISFSKGCFVGQEIIARTQNLGRIKRRMYGFHTAADATLHPGDPVYAEGNAVGQIVDVATTADASELLAVIRIDMLASQLTLGEDGGLPLRPVALPYAVPETI